MKFIVYPEVFEKLPDVCFGVVAGYSIDNSISVPEIEGMLKDAMDAIRKEIGDSNLKEYKYIVPYRQAFTNLGINPNKYMSSVEAMAKRVLKGKDLPSINSIVDLVNAFSLNYILPMGAHDIDALEGDIEIRFAVEGDTFIPFGSEQEEAADPGELIYTDSKRVRTRRWIWRQSDRGKITEKSTNIFFPIDGFEGANKERVLEARDSLASLLEKYFGCSTKKFFVDKDNREIEI